jgi:tripartite-type tricarboxylate transporter receptor subunit TctC
MILLVLLLVSPHFSRTMAQSDYPNRPIEVIIPWPPGGTADIGTRFFGEKWSEFLGQPIVVVNKPGGQGIIASRIAAGAKPDGYTLFSPSDGQITARLEKKDAGYDVESFRYFFLFSRAAAFFNVKVDAKWKTMKEFLSDAKQNPRKLRYGSVRGNPANFGTEMLSRLAGVELTYVPFKSSPESVTALLGGHVDLAATIGLSGMTGSPLIRILAVAEEERLYDFPEVPTLKELGYPIFMSSNISLCGPKGIPDEIVKKFTDVQQKVLAKYGKEIKERLPKLDQYPAFLDGKATMQLYKEREKKYREYAPLIGIKME